ncbi:MAG: rhomboid family intramembrane serine protease [Alphaproteobacteria bacterium]|nr:rhomboid family intramembrane serine protease [Alphaproteobacteria bacterium]
MIPFYDDNPTRRFAIVAAVLIVLNLAAFAVTAADVERAALGMGLIPARLLAAAELPAGIAAFDPWLTVLSSMFLHGGVMHVAGNMLYLWTFGNNIEDAMGPVRFVAFYLICGLAAAGAQIAVDPNSTIPMIGASGAVSGVLGAYLLLHPRASVYCLVFYRMMNLPAMVVLGWWIVVQIANGAIADPSAGGVAWFAHIGGFAAGAALIPLFKRREVPLFGGATRRGPWN